MATKAPFILTPEDGYVLIAAVGDSFTAEVRAGGVDIVVADSTPTSNILGHSLKEREILVRPGAGNAYAKANLGQGEVILLVTSP